VTCALLARCPCAFALNAVLDISQYAHTAWRNRDGFSTAAIDAIAQTPDGYLWLGTTSGLLRFDGVRTTPWQPPTGEALPSNWIRSLMVARDGTLWIGTLKGLVSWHAGEVRRFPHLAGASIDSLVQDRQGTVWVGAIRVPHGLLCAIEGSAATMRCDGEDGAMPYVASLFEDTRGNLWVGASTGLWRWRPGSPARYAGFDNPNVASAFIEEDDHALLIATRTGLKRLIDRRVEEYRAADSRGLHAHRLLRDRDGGVWVGTTGEGLLHVHHGKVERFTQADGLSSDGVFALFEDREGSIWVATAGGLDRFREFVVSTISTKQRLSSEPVNSVVAGRDGAVWLGTSHGLDKWIDGRVDHYREASPVWFLFEDEGPRLWVGTDRQFGLFERGRVVPISGMAGGVIRSMAVDRRGDFWIAYQDRGLFHLRAEREVESTPWVELGHTDFASAVAADRVRDGLWLGFYNGGIAYLADGEIRARYTSADGLGDGTVSDLQVDPDGTVWASTEGGLSRLKNDRVATLTSRNGLPCDAVQWIREDDEHSRWLNTPCGLVRVTGSELEAWSAASDEVPASTATVHPVVFDAADGVSGLPAAAGRPGIAKSIDGRLWFVRSDGVSVVDPRHLSLNRMPAPVHIERILADRQTFDAMTTGNGLRLPPLIRDLQIDYTALSLVAPEKMRFRYKLEGWDRDWQEVGTRRQAFYNKLAPRAYRFRVTAANNSGVWNETGASLDFSVAPAYYQTAWFPAFSVGLVLALIWTAHRVRLRIVQTHEREISALNERLMKAQEQERMRIAGELHDGVMQEMLSVTMMLGTAKRRIDDPSRATATIDLIQEKLIQVGTDLRQLSHGLHPPMLQEAGLPATVRVYCEEFSAASGVAMKCDCDESARDLSRGAALALFRVVQEALGNAAKHAQAKHIAVRLTRTGEAVRLVVSDDGAGFETARVAPRGLGLIMMRERATQLNGTFVLDSVPGRGTTICIAIPFR
jgi:signal transduction histidine kinase/ligand-binding sensor domain-containing protein